MEGSTLVPLDDRGPNKIERQIVRVALASSSHTIYYKPTHRGQSHAVFRSTTDREPLATGNDCLWGLQALESAGILEKMPLKVGRAAYRLTELGREIATAWMLEAPTS